jgi:hypothetical protein
MLKGLSASWLFAGWSAAVVGLVAASVAMEMTLSTSALLVMIGLVPVLIVLLLQGNAPSLTVAAMLHTEDANNSRS